MRIKVKEVQLKESSRSPHANTQVMLFRSEDGYELTYVTEDQAVHITSFVDEIGRFTKDPDKRHEAITYIIPLSNTRYIAREHESAKSANPGGAATASTKR